MRVSNVSFILFRIHRWVGAYQVVNPIVPQSYYYILKSGKKSEKIVIIEKKERLLVEPLLFVPREWRGELFFVLNGCLGGGEAGDGHAEG